MKKIYEVWLGVGGVLCLIMGAIGCAVEKEKGKMPEEGIEKRVHKGLAIGDQAPGFSLKDELGNMRTLEEFRGRRIVLYFYPMDDTPGCTKQACSIRDNYNLFEKYKIAVLGISYGSVASHKKFKEKYKLPFILLSDDKKKVAKMYNAKSFWIFVPQRKTYLIDEKGIIQAILSDVDPATHTRLVLERFGVI